MIFNEKKIIPFFTSTYSIGKSILTLDKVDDDNNSNRPQSIFSILKDGGLNDLFLIENNPSGFMRAVKQSWEYKINLFLGLKITVCSDIKDKSPESRNSEYKIILITKNDSGYDDLVKIYSVAATDGFFQYPRVDSNILEKYYNSNNLFCCYPFYSSFISRNILRFNKCIDIDFLPKNFIVEENGIPFEFLIKKSLYKYVKNNNGVTIPSKFIYYRNRDDFKAYIVYRALMKRGTLSKPKVDNLCSSEFCFESWLESCNA